MRVLSKHKDLSHTYDFKPREIFPLVMRPLVPVIIFVLCMHLGARLKLWPAPKSIFDMDRTVLLHQAEASQNPHDADIVLLGDSSCLMDVSTPDLNTRLSAGHKVLNLGTLSYMGLDVQAELLHHYLAANPDRVRWIVMLVHPEFLRRTESIADYVAALQAYYRKADRCPNSDRYGQLSCWLGLEIFRGRFWSRVVPIPLSGVYRQYYGFTWALWNFMSGHEGSATDPGHYETANGQGNAEYRLASPLKEQCRDFRSFLPQGAKLVVGITPIPESFALPNYSATYRRLLIQWSEWLQADERLEALPASMPDRFFASTTHLNASGAQSFTEILARACLAKIVQ